MFKYTLLAKSLFFDKLFAIFGKKIWLFFAASLSKLCKNHGTFIRLLFRKWCARVAENMHTLSIQTNALHRSDRTEITPPVRTYIYHLV